MTIEPNKVAIYIRWSTDDQGDGTTLDVQMEGCRHYALSQGWEVTADLIFIDDGYSGGTLDRPALARLRAAVQQERVACVVVFKLDRLSRSVVDTVNLVLQEWGERCHVKSAREPVDTTSHAGKLFFYMLVSYAEWERSVIRERTWGGRLRRAQEGRNPGFNAPYGYRVGPTPGALEIVAAEAAVVGRIYQMYLAGEGSRAITAALMAEGLRFRGGRPWSPSTVQHILANRVYCGDLVWGLRPHNPRHAKRPGEPGRLRAESPLAVREGAFPAIVARTVWEQAQAVRAARGSGPGSRSPGRAVCSRFLLTGLARCRCGSAVIGRAGTGLYYLCSGKNARGAAHCDCGYMQAEAVDAALVQRLRCMFGGQAGSSRVATVLQADLEQRLAGLLPQLKQVQRDLGRAQAQTTALGTQLRGGQLTAPEYRSLLADLRAETTALAQRKAELARQVDGLRHARLPTTEASTLGGGWDHLSIAQRKHLLRAVCRELTLYRTPHSADVQIEAVWAQA